ncbi:MAG TPA: hypothetical protein VMN79_08560 [Casimicrobiaceae bacterium]|nr:hypothetical protein [Casimicrobiaceae bacterium]
MKTMLAALCGAAVAAGCASAPGVQRVESNSSCDTALMAKMEAQWQPTMVQHYWVNCPQVKPKS